MLHVIIELSVNLPICTGNHCVCALAQVYYLIHLARAIAVSKQPVKYCIANHALILKWCHKCGLVTDLDGDFGCVLPVTQGHDNFAKPVGFPY